MDHFDISFACSIFSKSWDVPNHGFLGVAHLPVSPHLDDYVISNQGALYGLSMYHHIISFKRVGYMAIDGEVI